MKKQNKFLYCIDHIEEAALTILFIALSVVCFYQVFSRFVLHQSLSWSEAFLRLCFVWASCLGASCAFKRKSHLGVDAIVNKLPHTPRNIVAAIAYLLTIAFCVMAVVLGIKLVGRQIVTNQVIVSLDWPIISASLGIPVGFTLSAIRVIQVAYNDLTGRDDVEGHISEGLL